MPDDLFNLRNETAAAINLARQYADIRKNDPEFMENIIEGETDLFEAINRVDAALAEDELMIAVIEGRIKQLRARADAMIGRNETRRALLGSTLESIGKKTHRTPEGTISVADIPRKAMVTNEADIPSRFWLQQAPRLDLKGLTKALRDDEKVPGATLDNGGKTVRILRK